MTCKINIWTKKTIKTKFALLNVGDVLLVVVMVVVVLVMGV